MKQFLLLSCIVLAAGCVAPVPLHTGQSDNNKTYEVEYLFEHDGCKVYRFYDRGRYVYFTNCRGEAIANTDSTTTRNVISVGVTPEH